MTRMLMVVSQGFEMTYFGLVEFTVASFQVSFSFSQGHCHYSGYIEDVEGSSAALSLCSGLR